MTMEGGSLGGFYLRLKDFEIQEGHRIIYLYTYSEKMEGEQNGSENGPSEVAEPAS